MANMCNVRLNIFFMLEVGHSLHCSARLYLRAVLCAEVALIVSTYVLVLTRVCHCSYKYNNIINLLDDKR